MNPHHVLQLRRLAANLTRRVLLAALPWLLASALPAAELTFSRRASWPGYLMGSVKGIQTTDSTVWLGLDCVGGWLGSLLALDVSDPAAPVVLSSTATGAGQLWAFENTFAYAIDNSSSSSGHLEIYDVSAPSKPVLRSRTSIPVAVRVGLVAYQGYLWVFTEGGLTTYDIRDPAAPSYAGSLTWAGSVMPSQMVICNNFGVLMTRTYTNPAEDWLHVIDLTNPAEPVETGSMPVSMGYVSWWSGVPILTALDDYVYYVTKRDAAGVCHLEASKVTSSGTLEPAGIDLPLAGKQTGPLWPVGSFFYFSEYISGTTASLRVVDLTQRLQPVELASQGITLTALRGIAAAQNGHVFLALDSAPATLRALDATNPAQPVDLGKVWRTWDLYGLAGGSDVPAWYVQENGSSRFRLFKAADLLQGNVAPFRDWNLPFVSGSGGNDPYYLTQVLLHDNYCYMLSSRCVAYPTHTGQLDVFDLSGTASPVRTLSRQLTQSDSGVYYDFSHNAKIDGDELYLTYWPGVLDIYSLTNPASPRFISRASVDWAEDLEIHNGYAYLFTCVGTDSGGSIRRLEVVDVRDPAHLSAKTISREYTGGWHGTMALDGDLLYVIYFKNVSPYTTMLDVFDLTEPLNPARLSSTSVASVTHYPYNDLAILKPYAILGGPSLVVADISDPAHPKPAGTYDPNPFPQVPDWGGGNFNQVKTWQNHVLVKNDALGIALIDVGAPLITRQPSSRTNAFGTTASFAVEATGTTPLSYQWRRDGTNLLDGGRFSGVTATNLLLANVQPADACGYSVVVTNSFGSVKSSVAQLTVPLPPSPGRFANFTYSPVTGFSFVFRDGTVGQQYLIQSSTSMASGSWTDWQNFTYTEPIFLTDMSAAGAERRYYRAVTP